MSNYILPDDMEIKIYRVIKDSNLFQIETGRRYEELYRNLKQFKSQKKKKKSILTSFLSIF